MKKTTKSIHAVQTNSGARGGVQQAKKVLAVIMSLVVALVLIAGCAPVAGTSGSGEASVSATSEMSVAKSYTDVYDALKRTAAERASQSQTPDGDAPTSAEAPLAATESESSAPTENVTSSANQDAAGSEYSETNVQVEGIDEGDVVKTDGKNIYVVSDTEVVVLEAQGPDTKLLARVSFTASRASEALQNRKIAPKELYIYKDTLIILYDYSVRFAVDAPEGSDNGENDLAPFSSSNSDFRMITEIATFDVSNPENPQQINTYGQDGFYESSRLQGGILYLVSNYRLYDTSFISSEDPSTYVPSLYKGGGGTLLSTDDICMLPSQSAMAYSVITSFDVSGDQRVDQISLYGSTETLYMSTNNLYVSNSTTNKVETGSYQEGSYAVTEYHVSSSTRVSKLALDKGMISYQADTLMSGRILNQFAFDEYEDHLRMVTTITASSYRVLDDGTRKSTDYSTYKSEPSTNSLYVLDNKLNTVGKLEGMAEDERVYSVRFDGPLGYFVTFRQTDPLFAVDLSNPANPTIKGELKIPGFSTYMHVYSDGRLFGLGRAATESGRAQGVKLSMFDTSDPYNLTERHLLELDSRYSAALYNHKAIIIDQEKNLIGFPTANGYEIYGYSDEKGFYLRQTMTLGSYSANQRGLYIDEYFYLCTKNGVNVYLLDDLSSVSTVFF